MVQTVYELHDSLVQMTYTIIGAGIGGLTTALALEQQGLEYQLYERAPELKAVGAGIWLAPNALQVLDRLGVLEQVKTKGHRIDRITVAKQDLTPIFDNSQDAIKAQFGYTTYAIHRADLQELLRHNIPADRLHLDADFKSYSDLENGKIAVNFENGNTIETDYLIGADGIHSKVRKQLFPESQIRYSGQTCWRGIAPISLDSDFQHWGLELWGSQIRFGISQVSEHQVYWFAVVLAAAGQCDQPETVKSELLNTFGGFHPIVSQLINETPLSAILRNDISDLKPIKKWFQGRVGLIGDAGHATTPNMGQGGAQAIEDAYYLGQIAQKGTSTNPFMALQQQRYAKVNRIVQQSWSTGQMAHWKYGTGLRNFILKNLPKTLAEKKMMAMYTLD